MKKRRQAPPCFTILRRIRTRVLRRMRPLLLAQRDELPQQGHASHVGRGRFVAMESIRVRPASGIAKQRHVIIRNPGKGRCLPRGTSGACRAVQSWAEVNGGRLSLLSRRSNILASSLVGSAQVICCPSRHSYFSDEIDMLTSQQVAGKGLRYSQSLQRNFAKTVPHRPSRPTGRATT